MRPVYVSHGGLWCAAGSRLPEVCASLKARRRIEGRVSLLGQELPYGLAADPDLPWGARLEASLGAVGEGLDLRSLPPGAPLLIGSSSLSIGAVEASGWPPDPDSMIPLDEAVRRAWILENRGWTFTSGCTSGLQALEAAVALIEGGEVEEALVLGVELFNRTTAAGFLAMQLLSPSESRPMDQLRSGMVLGEAVAALRLCARPGPWRLHAPALALDATSPTGHAPDGSSIAAVMAQALENAGCGPEAIKAVKLQATGGPGTDAVEVRALGRIFGDGMPPLFSIKASLGHTLGACALAETAAVLACAEDGWMPPTAGFDAPDPDLGLSPCVEPTPWHRGPVLLNIQGFGGSLGSWVLERS